MKQAIETLEKLKEKTQSEIMTGIMDELKRLTNSRLSYFATYDPEMTVLTMIGWDRTAMSNCSLITKPVIYLLEETGLWGDCIRELQPIIVNDYPTCIRPNKKGHPEGRVQVKRHMNIPIMLDGKPEGIAGVGNKTDPYNDKDAEMMSEYMNAAWPVLKAKLDIDTILVEGLNK